MEIAPIPGIRSLPAAKVPLAGLRPPEIFDLDGPARPGDSQGQHQERKGAGAEEDDDLLLDAESGEQQEDSSRKIDYFA